MGREGITTNLSDEIRQNPQKDDDEQQGDPDEILPSVVYQDRIVLTALRRELVDP